MRYMSQDYLRFNSLHKLVQVYEDIDYNLYTLLDLYKIIETKQYVTSRNTRAVRYGNKLPYLSDTCQKLRNDLGILQTTRNGLKNNLSVLQSEISGLIKTKRALD